MKRLSTIISLIILINISTSCKKVIGEGPVISETRNETGFTGVAISVPADVVYKQSSTYNIEIKAQRNILDLIESPVVNGELRVRFKRNINLRSYDRIVMYISSPAIFSLSLSGSGKLESIDSIVTSRFRMALSGSGSISVNKLRCQDNLETVISGSGSIQVNEGSCQRENILVSGSGKTNLQDVTASHADVNISGSGDVRLHAINNLDVRISGSGDVYYRGNPSVTSHVSGSGKVTRL